MKTDELIHLLATGAGPAPRRTVRTRIGIALVGGLMASTIVCLAVLGLNPELDAIQPALVVKLLYGLGVLGAATWWMDRAARPAARANGAAGALLLVVALMAAWAGLAVAEASAEARAGLLLGHSWASCPGRVATLALPAVAAALWALHGLAPTRPRWAGFIAGLFGGSAGALAYALFCNETSPAFVLIWYSLGMLLPAGLGALIGPRLLRW